MTGDVKRSQQTFELKAGPLPSLRPVGPSRPAVLSRAAGPDEPASPDAQLADGARPGCPSQRDLILRLVEAVKAL